MLSSSTILVAFVAFLLPWSLVAHPQPFLQPRADCSSGVVGELSGLLKIYSPAQSYCSAHYSLSCTNPKVKRAASTTTTTATSAAARYGSTTTTKKSSSSTTTPKSSSTVPKSSSTTSKSSSTSPKTSTSTVDAKSSALSKLLQQAANVVASVCTCIENAPACNTSNSPTTVSPTTVSPTTASPTTSSSTTSVDSCASATPVACNADNVQDIINFQCGTTPNDYCVEQPQCYYGTSSSDCRNCNPYFPDADPAYYSNGQCVTHIGCCP